MFLKTTLIILCILSQRRQKRKNITVMKEAAHKNIIKNLPYERDFFAGLQTARLLCFEPSERKKTVSLTIFC